MCCEDTLTSEGVGTTVTTMTGAGAEGTRAQGSLAEALW